MADSMEWEFETETEDGELVLETTTVFYNYDLDGGDYYFPPTVTIDILGFEGATPDEDEIERIIDAINETEYEQRSERRRW